MRCRPDNTSDAITDASMIRYNLRLFILLSLSHVRLIRLSDSVNSGSRQSYAQAGKTSQLLTSGFLVTAAYADQICPRKPLGTLASSDYLGSTTTVFNRAG